MVFAGTPLHFAVGEEQHNDDAPTNAIHITGNTGITSRNVDTLAGVGNAQDAQSEIGNLRGAVATAAPDGQSYNIPGASLKLKRGTKSPELR